MMDGPPPMMGDPRMMDEMMNDPRMIDEMMREMNDPRMIRDERRMMMRAGPPPPMPMGGPGGPGRGMMGPPGPQQQQQPQQERQERQPTFYEILQVPPTATRAQIKQSYLNLVKMYDARMEGGRRSKEFNESEFNHGCCK